jgi:hypothetical protein
MHCHYHQQSLIVFDQIKIKILFSFLTVKVDDEVEVGHYLFSKGYVFYTDYSKSNAALALAGATAFSITTHNITTFSKKTLSIMTFSIKTLNISTFSIKTLSITTLSIKTLSIKGLFAILSITMLCHYVE